MNDFADAVRIVCEEAAELQLPSLSLVVDPETEHVVSRPSHFVSLTSLPSFDGLHLAFEENFNETQPISIEIVDEPPVVRRISTRSTSLPARYVEEPQEEEDKLPKASAEKRRPSDETPAPFACDHCHRRFKRREALQRHIGTHDEKAFLCDVCEQTFSSALSLREHRAIHDGELPYECGHCKRKFRQNSCLRRHLLLHSAAAPPHECPTCGRRFLQKVYLRSHLRSHTGIRPYPCSTCGKSFGHRSTLKRHLVTHTSDRPHVCDVCSATFADSSSWRRHVRNHNSDKTTTTAPAAAEIDPTATIEIVDVTPVGAGSSWTTITATSSDPVDYVQNPDFRSLEYFDWLSDFIGSVSASQLPMEDELFASVSRVHTDISDVLATPCGPLSHDKDAFLCLVNMSQQLHAVIQNHRSRCSTATTADVQPRKHFNGGHYMN